MALVIGYQSAVQASSFERWWQCRGAWVEPLNKRRDGESGVQLLLPVSYTHLTLPTTPYV